MIDLPSPQPSSSVPASRGTWGNQFQKHQSPSYIQPPSFYRPASTWGSGGRDVERRGFGSADPGKKATSSSGSFLQNRFTTLSSEDQDREVENLLEIVRKDIEAWEISNQWLFSCYSVAKEYACVSGLVDISPEELRMEYYNSRTGGSLQNYADSIQQLSNQQRNRMLEMKKPNSSVRSSMSAELRKPNQQKPETRFGEMQTSNFGASGFASNSVNSETFSFKPSAGLGNTTTTSGFGCSSAPASSTFGNASTFAVPTSTSASASGAFGISATSSTPGPSLFGSSAPFGSNPTTASPGFGSSASTCAPTTSVFGNTVTTTANAFGGNVTTTANAFGGNVTATTNAFGSNVTTTTTNAFGGNVTTTPNAFGSNVTTTTTNAFGGNVTTTPNAFGSNVTTTTTNAFGGNVITTPNAFGGNVTATPNAFGGNVTATPNAFGGNVTTTPNAFGGNVTTANAFGSNVTTTPNAFGCSAVSVSQPQNIAGSNNSVSGYDKLYTPRTELSVDDLQEFEAKKFTLGRIPLRPPPIELLNV
ncbi:nucleoporin NUP42-like isoform X2 [Scyliorhinus canicula]|uniref:nucleoporin NUP42-like isoform X2 n=1 Tax=Scyliorhinus canicula TaxID=7830 RepID=UPI0018F5C340|nr:nucleoporin NUP42-like isoform X2 [Scyliorhinus canicula]